MTKRKAHTGTVFKINLHLLGAFSYGVIAWLIWPDNPQWRGFGLLSIMLAIAAPALLGRAIYLMKKLKDLRDREAEIDALGGAPKSVPVATEDDLRNLGILR